MEAKEVVLKDDRDEELDLSEVDSLFDGLSSSEN